MSLASLLKKTNRIQLFTTPSHSGKFCIFHKFYQWYRNDISETEAYEPQKALEEAELCASEIYGTKSTHFLSNGSTSGVIAAVLSCCDKNSKILVCSTAHKCHKNAAILAGAEIITYQLKYDEDWGIYLPPEPDEVDELLNKYKPNAIIITSPTYEGLVPNIKKLSEICKNYGVYLIVDEAHGALYPFSDELPESAVKYADFTIQSLHKTAGGINPTALLHVNCDIDARKSLELINTTSPSYPMLATIEANINYLNSSGGRKSLHILLENIKYVKSKLTNIQFFGDDITKLLIKKEGMSGHELSDYLYNKLGIEDEITNEKSTMLLTGIGTTKEKLFKLLKLKNL